MKKRFTILIAALMLLVFMTPSMAGWGQTRSTTGTLDMSTSQTSPVTNNDVTFTWTSSNIVTGGGNSSGFKANSNMTVTIPSGATLKSISKVNGNNWGSGATIKVYAGTNSSGTEIASIVTETPSYTISSNNTGTTYYFENSTGKNAWIKSLSIEYEGGGSTVAIPTFDPAGGVYTSAQNVTISCTTQGATIYYTTDGSIPDDNSTEYTAAIPVSTTTTIKAIAYVGNDASTVASSTYTLLTPLTTMQAIYDANSTSTDQDVAITFNNWIITGSYSSYAFLSDGDKGLLIFGSGHGFVQGDILSGTVVCKLNRYIGMARLTQLTNGTAGIHVENGANPTPTVTTINTMEGVNTGKLITLNGLTCHVDGTTYTLTDGENHIVYPYSWGGLSGYRDYLSEGKTYDVTGVFCFGNSTNEKRINPRSVTEIMPTPAALPFSWTGGGKTALMAFQGVTAYGLGSDYADANAPYLVKFDNTNDYILVRTDSQPDVVTIGVKMLGGSSTSKITVQASTDGVNFDAGEELTISGSTNAELELTSTRTFGADVRYIKMLFTKGSNVGVGPISITKYIEKYNISLSSPTTGGSFTADKATAAAGETVTLTPIPATHYVFDSWTVCKTSEPSTTIAVNNNQFEMPTYAVTVGATFTALQERTITISTEIENNVAVDVTDNKAYAGDEVTILIDAPTGEFLTSLTVTGNTTSNLITLSPEVSSSEDTYTFIMPDENVTISATFAGEYTVQFSVNGTNTGSQDVTAGNSVTLSSQVPPTGFTFAGWTTNPTNFNNIITGSSYTPTADVTLYAVYSKTEYGATVINYQKVTSTDDVSDGDYLIIYESESVAFNGGINSDNYDVTNNNISVVISGNKISVSDATESAKFVVASAAESSYTLRSAAGYYIGRKSNKTGIDASDSEEYTNTFSFSDGNATIKASNNYILRYNSDSGQKRFRYYSGTSCNPIQLYKKVTITPSTTSYYTRVFPLTPSITEDIEITGPTVITSGTILDMGSYSLTNGTAANLVIEDGGVLITKSEGVQATVKKNVEGASTWGNGKSGEADGWYFIASPVDGADYSTAITTGDDNDYDLFMLDWENKKWLNKKVAANSSVFGDGFTRGTGYLYASEAGNTISVAGEIQPLSNENKATVNITKAGWNLIGNPLTCKVTVDCAFSQLNGGSAVTSGTADNTVINPFQGIAVYSENGNETVTFTKAESQAAAAPSNSNSLQMTLAKKVTSRGEVSTKVVDNAVVSFNNSKGMPKFNMLGGNAKLYIPQNNEEYAVVFSDRQGDMPLNFKADELGTYTINFETSDRTSLQGIYLIDMLEEQEIDLSVNPSYTFIGSPADRAARFKIVFRTGFENSPNNIFAYQNGSDIIVSGEGELQIFDVMGRMVSRQRVNGVETVNAMPYGVYILKLNGMTQKIVVR